ncbi:JAB N-terminal domain-containing protein [Calothrix sp. PCC 6303]|uniref:JAB N-terminal domain-containing protein n=1 Tax=Calothrix sp. PCC 6303 TaxID=1170562 RepID=UPI0002A0464C|nr:JAB N-terminal domain-containing protein [Calothrix sp. PCC 6303]AFZ01313.1 hypothetical protein Cal6303_2297 [Calothrix sp. PCC 6303]
MTIGLDYRIELYRGENRKFFGSIPFLPIVRESLERLLGHSLLLESIQIIILQVPEEPLWMESPIIENLVPEFGYTYIRVYQGNFLIYQHPHRFYDVVTQTLQTTLSNQYPEETWWGFRVDIPGIPQIAAANLQPQASTLYSNLYSKTQLSERLQSESLQIRQQPQEVKPSFKIRRLEEEEPAIKTLADFGSISEPTQHIDEFNPRINQTPVKIVLTRSLYEELCHQRPLSRQVEEGGFLIGKVYRDGDAEDTYLLQVTNALTANHTGASFLHLTFTGDSFVEVKRTLNQNHPGERLLGWYHTHLFPATQSFGLSSIDVHLHFSTFTISWQLAGLINIDGNKRTLRFYARQGNKMVLCPYWVIDERD